MAKVRARMAIEVKGDWVDLDRIFMDGEVEDGADYICYSIITPKGIYSITECQEYIVCMPNEKMRKIGCSPRFLKLGKKMPLLKVITDYLDLSDEHNLEDLEFEIYEN